ncbi:uncharacterized protein BDV17DRAFT_56248 [Aspergillus undulatus]|uniref:uncharacterized protein n=1 Tax=Aspergillus undulatus TaxID=1810928 RepID=UPI003CCE5126
MRDDETTMQPKRITKRKYFSDPSKFRNFFWAAALQARRLYGLVYVSSFRRYKRNHAHFATRSPCLRMHHYPPLPFIYFIFHIYFQSCVCLKESKNQTIN